jgi:hypothetical protein
MLANLRRKIGIATGQQTPVPNAEGNNNNGLLGSFVDPSTPLPPLTIDDLGFAWPSDIMFSPTNIPIWLQEAVS